MTFFQKFYVYHPKFLWIGLFLIMLSFFLVGNNQIFLIRASASADGVVTGFDSTYYNGKTRYQPIISYTGPSDKEYSFIHPTLSFSHGQHVPVRYNPTQPQNARAADFRSLWLLPLSLCLLGLSMTYFSLGRKHDHE